MTRCSVAFTLLLLVGGPAAGQQPSVEAVEHERLTAVLRNDVATLDRILASDWISTTASGERMTKEQYLAALRTGTRRFVVLDHSDLRVTVHERVAILTGRTRAVVRDASGDHRVKGQFTHVYLNEQGRWVMLAAHTSQLPSGGS